MNSSDRYDSLFQFYAQRRGLDWRRLKAQAAAESGFHPSIQLPKGARGLMQLLQSTFDEWAKTLAIICPDILNPEHSICAAAAEVKRLEDQFEGVAEKVLAAYSWGSLNLRKSLAQNGEAGWQAHLPLETQNYLARVNAYYRQFSTSMHEEKAGGATTSAPSAPGELARGAISNGKFRISNSED